MRVDFELTVLSQPEGPIVKREVQGFTLSFDLWEERFAVSRAGSPPRSISHLRANDAENWCLENLTMSAAFELVDQGITANVVHPPITDTGWIDDDVRRVVETSSELFHVATPEQVAEVVAFLCSDAGALVTGNRIVLR